MRIRIAPSAYAEWHPGCRTINLYTEVPADGYHYNYDCISFGYDKPDNTVTAIDAMDVLIRHLIDASMLRHPAGRDTVSQECDCVCHDSESDSDHYSTECVCHECRPGMYSDAICGACKAPLT